MKDARPFNLAMLTFVVILIGASVMAQQLNAGGYDLSWNTIDGGGGMSTGGTFEVSGTIGQPDAGSVLSGGSFAVSGGFWSVGIEPQPTCPPDVAPPPFGDGVVNVIDLLMVIAHWGSGAG